MCRQSARRDLGSLVEVKRLRTVQIKIELEKMACTLQCRVQFLDDTDPFSSTKLSRTYKTTNVYIPDKCATVKSSGWSEKIAKITA